MITRRFLAQAKTQNWFGALLEIIIVVVGVFLGIEASNWNQARNDHERGRDYLRRIDTDLATDIKRFDDTLTFWKRVSDYGTTALRLVDTGSTGDAHMWPVVLAFFHASQIGEFSVTRSTFDEMRSAGQIGLISDPELRRAISHYYINAGNPSLSERPRYREHVRGLLPIDIQTYVWQNCYQSGANESQQLIDCESPIPPERAAEIAAALRQNEPLTEELRYWVSTMHIASVLGRTYQAEAVHVRQMIAAALSKS